MQVDIAAVDDAVFAVHRMWEVDTFNASVIKAEVLALDNGAEHLLFDCSHDLNCCQELVNLWTFLVS